MSFKPPSDFQQSRGGQVEEDQQNLEMFLIQIPKKFDIAQLNGVKYVPGQIVDVATDDSLPGQLSAVYQLAASTMQDLDLKPLIKNKQETIVGQPVSGHLSVTKAYRVESKPSPYTLPGLQRPGPSLVPIPTGLRERFTPFGSGPPCCGPRPHKLSQRPNQLGESTSLSDERSEKKKKKKKKRDVDSSVGAEAEPPGSADQNSSHSCSEAITDSAASLADPDDSLQETSPVREKHKKKKQKRHKERGADKGGGDSESLLLNGNLDMDDSSAGNELRGILSNTAKAKKLKKNVSFSHDDSVFMNSSGDASRLTSDKEEGHACDSQQPMDVNGNSEQYEKVKKGKKRKRSSGYSSPDTSVDISSPSLDNGERPAKKKKKKHKATHEDSS